MLLKLIVEAVLVGIYSSVLFLILFTFISNKYILLFVLGFLKHFLSYYLTFQTFYCNNSFACNKVLHKSGNSYSDTTNKNITYAASNSNLFIESILEGVWFLIIGSSIFYAVNKKIRPSVIIFLIGVATHLLTDFLNIHEFFCKHNCVENKSSQK